MKAIIKDDLLKIEDGKKLNSGSINYYNIDLEFNEAWNGLTKCAIIKGSDEDLGEEIAIVGNNLSIDRDEKGSYILGFKAYTLEYRSTQDIEIKTDKDYFIRTGTEPNYIYTRVDNPVNEDISIYYEVVKNYQISTNLIKIKFNSGAGSIETKELKTPKATEWEIYIAQIQELINNIQTSGISIEDMKNYINEHKEELKGDVGPQGMQGPKGDGGENGVDGVDGQDGYTPIKGIDYFDGQNGKDGTDGKDGKDGITPTIGLNGNWYLENQDTGKPSRGQQGPKGDKGEQGIQGVQGLQGAKGETGLAGKDAESVAEYILEESQNIANRLVETRKPKSLVICALTDIHVPPADDYNGFYVTKNEIIEGAIPVETNLNNEFNPKKFGFEAGRRFASDGSLASQDLACMISNYIEVNEGDTIRVRCPNQDFNIWGQPVVTLYDENKNPIIAYYKGNANIDIDLINTPWTYATTIPTNVKYIRCLGIPGTGEATRTAIKNTGYAIREINKLQKIDLLSCLGDYIQGANNATKVINTEGLNHFYKSIYNNIENNIFEKGNHDGGIQAGTAQKFSVNEIWSLIGAKNTGKYKDADTVTIEDTTTDVSNRLFGYIDFEKQKIRAIYLNTSDSEDAQVSVSAEQLQWFTSVALDFSDKNEDEINWSYIILSHIPLTMNSTFQQFITAIDNYQAQDKAKAICIFHGHCHNFRKERVGTSRIWQICIPNLCNGRSNEYATYAAYKNILGELDENNNPIYYYKMPNTADETSFNVVNIDRETQKIYCFNYGQGPGDRILDFYEEAPIEPPAPNYTNLLDDAVITDNARFNSTGQISQSGTCNYWCAEKYIPCAPADTIRVRLPQNKNLIDNPSTLLFIAYKSDKTFINSYYANNTSGIITVDDDGLGWTFHAGSFSALQNMAYIRVCGTPVGSHSGDEIVTINEEIN